MLSHVQLIRKAVWSSFVITGEQCDEALISKDYVPIDFGPEETKTTAELGNYFITNFMLLAQLQGKAFESTIERTLLRDKLTQNCTRRIVLLRHFQAGGHYSLPSLFFLSPTFVFFSRMLTPEHKVMQICITSDL